MAIWESCVVFSAGSRSIKVTDFSPFCNASAQYSLSRARAVTPTERPAHQAVFIRCLFRAFRSRAFHRQGSLHVVSELTSRCLQQQRLPSACENRWPVACLLLWYEAPGQPTCPGMHGFGVWARGSSAWPERIRMIVHELAGLDCDSPNNRGLTDGG